MESTRLGDTRLGDTELRDIVEIGQLLARWGLAMTVDDTETIVDCFSPDGTYSAFGSTYTVEEFLALKKSAPQGLYNLGTPVVRTTGASGTGRQSICFIDQTDHSMRIGYYTDTYRRTADGWRLQSRSMTFLRRSGTRDAGRPDDPSRPRPEGAGSVAADPSA
jgi:hypothetical protein